MRKVQIYVTENHTSITVENGAAREVSGRTLPTVVEAMHAEDRVVLANYCAWVLRMIDKLDGCVVSNEAIAAMAVGRAK